MKVHLARLFGFAIVIAGSGTAIAQHSNQLPRPLAQAVHLSLQKQNSRWCRSWIYHLIRAGCKSQAGGHVSRCGGRSFVARRTLWQVDRDGPAGFTGKIQAEATQLLFDEMQPTIAQAGATQVGSDGRYQVRLAAITWREFEDSLAKLVGKQLPVTTSRNGEQARFH